MTSLCSYASIAGREIALCAFFPRSSRGRVNGHGWASMGLFVEKALDSSSTPQAAVLRSWCETHCEARDRRHAWRQRDASVPVLLFSVHGARKLFGQKLFGQRSRTIEVAIDCLSIVNARVITPPRSGKIAAPIGFRFLSGSSHAGRKIVSYHRASPK